MIKRLFDICSSLFGLIIFSPLLVIIAILIKIEDGGPVFYRGERVGLHGTLFKIFKFRTMVMNADQIGGSSTADDDPRITKIGRILRKGKLDELPQFFNVLFGDMSFVGPRPEVKFYTDMYTEEEKLILTIRPGITDLATIWNSDEGALLEGSDDPDRTYLEEIRPEKIRLQLEYLCNRSIFLDFKIIFQTLLKIIKR